MWLLHSRLTGHFVLGNYWVVAHEVEATVFNPDCWEGETKDTDLVQLVRLCMIMNDWAAGSRMGTAGKNRMISARTAILMQGTNPSLWEFRVFCPPLLSLYIT